jgi:recombination protein RecA
MVWGDGCLKLKQRGYVEFVIGHTEKQREYIEHKQKILHSIFGGKLPKISERKFELGGKEHTELRITKQHPYFRYLHRKCYSKDRKKWYTRQALDYLNPEGIAYWYMDDGGVSKNKNKVTKEVTSCEMRIATYCTEEEIDTIITYFKEVWEIQGKKRYHKKSGKWYLVFNTKESKKLELLIKPYIIPSMEYKLPSKWVPRVQDT